MGKHIEKGARQQRGHVFRAFSGGHKGWKISWSVFWSQARGWSVWISTKSGHPFCFLEYGFPFASLGVPGPVLPQRTFSSAYKEKNPLLCFLTRTVAVTAPSIRRPVKSEECYPGPSHSQNSLESLIILSLISLVLFAGPLKKGAQMMNWLTSAIVTDTGQHGRMTPTASRSQWLNKS